MAAALQFPFTSAQWKELERQAMIYKYMMASIPVPTHLLFPISTNFPAEITTSTKELIYMGGDIQHQITVKMQSLRGVKELMERNGDVQKYCERHMHRGRPRSRKHVEVQPLVSQNNNYNGNKKTKLNNTNSQQMVETTVQSNGTSHVLPKMNTDLSIKTLAKRDVRLGIQDKMMGIEMVGQQWQNFMNPKIENHSSLFGQQYEGEGMNLFSYTDPTGVRDVNLTNEESRFFLNSHNVELIMLN